MEIFPQACEAVISSNGAPLGPTHHFLVSPHPLSSIHSSLLSTFFPSYHQFLDSQTFPEINIFDFGIYFLSALIVFPRQFLLSAMPGTIKVSVLGFVDLPSSSSSSISVTVSMGKNQFQTWDKGEFAFSLTSLRDVLVITVNNVEGNEISRADIQAKSIVEKGLWDDHFPLAGGGRVHLQLQFLLNQGERDRIRAMRQSAVKKKQEEHHSLNFQNMEDATLARSNNASFKLNPEISASHKDLQVKGLRDKDRRSLSSPALTSTKLESDEKGSKIEEKQKEFDQSQQTPNDAGREKNSSSTAPVLPEINIYRSDSIEEKKDHIINSRCLDNSVSLREYTNILEPSGLVALSESPPFRSDDIVPKVNDQLDQKTVIAPVDEIHVQNISSEENIQSSESTVDYGMEVSTSSKERVHKPEDRTPMEKTPITVMQMNTTSEGSQSQDMRLQFKIPSIETYFNTVNEQKSLKEDQSTKPKNEKTKPQSSASDTEALIYEDPKYDEEEIKKRDPEIKLAESFKRTESLGGTLLQKSKATALEEQVEESKDQPKEVYARDEPPDEKTGSRPAEVFIKDRPKDAKEDIKKRYDKINVFELLERTKSSGDRLLQKSKAAALNKKMEDSVDHPKEVNAMDKPRDEKAKNQPIETHIKDQSKEVCMKNEIEPQEFIETYVMEVEAANVSERVVADQLRKSQLSNLVDNPVEIESTRKTPSKNFLEKSKPEVSMEEQHFTERSNIWLFPDDATNICVTSGSKTLADLMAITSGSSSSYQGEMRKSMEEHRGDSGSGVFKDAESHPENRKSKPLVSNSAETSEGLLKQTLNIAFMVGFGTLVLLTRLRKKRNNRVVIRSTNLRQ